MVAANTLIWDLVDPTELINYVRAYADEMNRQDTRFVLSRWLPIQTTDEIEFKVRKGDLDDVDVARYRAWDTPAPITGRPGTTRIEGELGPISRMIPISEEETVRLRRLQGGSSDPLVDKIFADAARMVRSVYARLEMAMGDVIDDGIVSIQDATTAAGQPKDQEGLKGLTADFGRAANSSKTTGIVWSTTATATPLADLLGWVEDYVDINGVEPEAVVMTRQIKGFLALNQEMRDYAASGGTTPTRLNDAILGNIMAAEGLPPFLIMDNQFRVDGARTRVFPTDKAYLMPPPGVGYGETRMGITAEAIKAAELGFLESSDAAGVVAVNLSQDHPVQTFTLGTGVGIPITPNPDLVYDLTVL